MPLPGSFPFALALVTALSGSFPTASNQAAALHDQGWVDGLLLALEQEPSPSAPRSEGAQRAYLLYVLALVTDWPEGTFAEPGSPLVIGLLGGDEFALDQDGLRLKTVKGRKVVVRRSRSLEALKGSQILYITPGAGQDLPRVLHALGSKSVLTVGEQDNFTQLGGIIRCNPAEGLVPSEVNIRVAKEGRLTFRSQFLKMVTRVAY